MRIKSRLFLSAFAILIAILVFGWWIISRPLPVTGTPPIDEARDRATGDDAMWDRDLYKALDEVRIESVSPEADEVYRLILLPTFHLPITDGAIWIVEARDSGAIRSISRITPRPKVLELCRFFLRLAGREDYYKGYWS